MTTKWIIKTENGQQVNGSQMPLPSAWENISTPTIEQMQEFGFVEYLAPFEPIPTVTILDVTRRQIKTKFFLMGITEAMIESAIGTLSSPSKEIALIAYRESNDFQRNNPLVSMVGALLGMSGDQLDQMWIEARML